MSVTRHCTARKWRVTMTDRRDILRTLRARSTLQDAMDTRVPPSGVILPDADTFVIEDIGNKLYESIAEQREQAYRDAIRDTDWSETAVLRIIEHYPIHSVGVRKRSDDDELTENMSVGCPVIDVERYATRAPPLYAHADGEHRCSVATVTKPLLDQLADEHDPVRALLEESDD